MINIKDLTDSLSDTLHAVLGHGKRRQWILALRAVLCGAIAGLLVSVYRQGIEYGTQFARWMYAQLLADPSLLILWGSQ